MNLKFQMEKRDNITFRHIEHFDEIIRPANSSSAGMNSSVTNLTNPVPLEDLLPDSPFSFYRYNGSLTTPLCNEAVIWTVFDIPIALSQRQVSIIRYSIVDYSSHQFKYAMRRNVFTTQWF
jgi:carbonic anhydrase